MTKKKRYKRYSPEFKREALKRTAEEGITDVQVCEELGISARQLLGTQAPFSVRSLRPLLAELRPSVFKETHGLNDGLQ